jgi:hypothetical protein
MQRINHNNFVDTDLYYYKNKIILIVKEPCSSPCLKELVQIQDTIYSIDQIINDVSKSRTRFFLNNHSQAAAEGYKLDFNEFCEEHIKVEPEEILYADACKRIKRHQKYERR